jgi:LL-diaminopimelate aminotransferase
MHEAVDEMGRAESFRGYGPEQGYPFLREAILAHNYTSRGIDISADEIFISDGSKGDCGNIQELFGALWRGHRPESRSDSACHYYQMFCHI